MKVSELLAQLNDMPLNAEVWAAADDEGNSFHQIRGVRMETMRDGGWNSYVIKPDNLKEMKEEYEEEGDELPDSLFFDAAVIW